MLFNAGIVLAATYLFGSWLAGASLLVLILVWRLLPAVEGPPVLALAMTTQWAQVTIGLFYVGVTGRVLKAIEDSNYERMLLVGLGCVMAMTLGLAAGVRIVQRYSLGPRVTSHVHVSLRTLWVIYAGAILATGGLQEIAYRYPTLTQAILALSFARLALLSLVLRRLVQPTLRASTILGLLAFEVGLGFTGYFSDFKEPLLLATLAVLEIFDRRRVDHWIAGGALAGALAVAFVMWMGVRNEYRQDFDDAAFANSRSARLARIQALSTDWFRQRDERLEDDVDRFVDRAWTIYYPALTLDRVPSVVPHTDGQLMRDVLVHLVTPRILYPDKPPLPNESEFVRKYAGVQVAGAESSTTFAFGYSAESYVDFGMPLMFVPMLLFGFAMGAAYIGILHTIAHREIAVSLVTCIFWLNLYQFERSWSKMIGLALTMMVYLGGAAFVADRWLLLRRFNREPEDESQLSPQPAYPSLDE